LKKSNICTKCGSTIQHTTDVVCLNCGNLLNMPKTIINNIDSTTKTYSYLIHKSLSFIILIITIFISYAYIFNFQIFLKITDYFFHKKDLTKTSLTLKIYRKIALNKDLSEINFKLNQLKLETKNTQEKLKQNKTLIIKYLSHNINKQNKILNLNISLKNNTPFKYSINQNFFYLKDQDHIYEEKQTDTCILTLKPWETKKISLSFKKFLFNHNQKFDGELIFNNSKKYFKNKISFKK